MDPIDQQTPEVSSDQYKDSVSDLLHQHLADQEKDKPDKKSTDDDKMPRSHKILIVFGVVVIIAFLGVIAVLLYMIYQNSLDNSSDSVKEVESTVDDKDSGQTDDDQSTPPVDVDSVFPDQKEVKTELFTIRYPGDWEHEKDDKSESFTAPVDSSFPSAIGVFWFGYDREVDIDCSDGEIVNSFVNDIVYKKIKYEENKDKIDWIICESYDGGETFDTNSERVIAYKTDTASTHMKTLDQILEHLEVLPPRNR